MSRRTAVAAARALVAVLAVFALASTAAAETGGPRITEASGSNYPDLSYVLTLPSRQQLAASQVHVTENGKRVKGVAVTSEDAGDQTHFAVVVVIDASNSMAGAPIESALAAARALEAKRSSGQALSIITFNDNVDVALPFTTDSGKIDDALSETPTLGEGTHIYDALSQAGQLLRDEGAESGSIVLLSDGADVGSVAKSADVVNALRGEHVKVYSVGLKSPQYNASALSNVAEDTGGTYAEANHPGELEGIFSALGTTLSNQYLLTYQSAQNPNTHVAVAVSVDGVPGSAEAAYATPKLHFAAPGPYHPSLGSRVIESPITALLFAGALALFVGWVVLSIANRGLERTPDRVGRFVEIAGPAGEADRGPTITRRPQRVESHRLWRQLETTLSVAEIRVTAGQVVVMTTIATVGACGIFYLLLGPWGLVLGLTVPFFVRSFIASRLAKKRRAFAEQVPENLDVLASALRAGHTLVSGMAVVVDNSPEPSRSELQRVIAEERLGAPLEDALKVVVERMDNRDIDQVALVARLQREMGSNSAEVLDRVVETVRARMELRRMVRTLTAQGRFTRWILTGIPVFLALAMTLLNPGYLSPLFHTSSGQFLVVCCCLMVLLASVIIRRIVDIKV